MDSISSIYKLLTQKNRDLEDLVTRVKLLKRQNFLLRECLPETIRDHCVFIPVSDLSLTILVDSPLQATQLKYEARNIINKIKGIKGFRTIQSINIKVDPMQVKARPVKPAAINTPIPKSESGSRLLAALSESVDDASLSEALKRLSRNLQESH
ncbi:MAG: DUF721 domain-containing protein [Gammaproteobacteria bacterium]|nr:DUF721 domain-containing protein [Gammaproteobacteria bacterium]MDH5651511.1 DUF721 domain-containing protein [Gammaproteobacteria bacterium]